MNISLSPVSPVPPVIANLTTQFNVTLAKSSVIPGDARATYNSTLAPSAASGALAKVTPAPNSTLGPVTLIVSPNGTLISDGSPLDNSDELPKAVITIACLFLIIAVGVGIAKLAEWCYDRRAVQDDASDISEHTKEILRSRLAQTFGKFRLKQNSGPKPQAEQDEIAKRAIRIWSSKARKSNQARRQAGLHAAPSLPGPSTLSSDAVEAGGPGAGTSVASVSETPGSKGSPVKVHPKPAIRGKNFAKPSKQQSAARGNHGNGSLSGRTDFCNVYIDSFASVRKLRSR